MIVDYLYRFTPAEILILRDGYDVKLSDIFKFTFVDLIYKKVICFDLLQHFEVKTKFFISISKGLNYHQYNANQHEVNFKLTIKNHERLLLNEYVRDYLKKSKNGNQIINSIIEQQLEGCFDRSFLDGLFNRYKRNEHAKVLYRNIETELRILEAELQKNNVVSEENIKQLTSLNGNILFLNKDTCPIIKDIEKEIQYQLNKDNRSDFDFGAVDFSSGLLDIAFSSLDTSGFDFDGFGGGDFGGGGTDGSWDILDISFD
jgi:uncharacterized membrane protein YgcG